MLVLCWWRMWGLLKGCAFGVVASVVFSILPAFGAEPSDKSSVEGVLQNTEQRLEANDKQKALDHSYLPAGVTGEGAPASDQGGDRFFLKKVRIVGAETLSSAALQACARSYVGRSVVLSELPKLSDCMTNLYTDAGYSLSRVIVPPQDVTGGVLTLQAIEGYVAAFEVEGDPAEQFPVAAYVQVLMQERPLRQKSLERQLMLLNDVPGLALEDTAFEEITELSGAFKLVLKVKTWRAWMHSEMDNRGSDAVGPVQSYQSVFLNSPFGRGASVGVSYSSIPDASDELNFGRVTVDVPLNVDGLVLSGFVSGSETRPSDERELDDTRYRSLKGGVSLTWAALRQRDLSVWLGTGLWASHKTYEDVTGRFVRDELRGVQVNGRFDFIDRFEGDNSLYVSLRQGLDVAGASREGDGNLSNDDGDGVFTKFYLDYARYQKLDENWSLKVDAALQLASDDLLSSEEFYIGGSRFGRGFESGVLSGDSGAGFGAELAYHREFDLAFINGATLFGFVDGAGILEDGDHDAEGAFVVSAGGGVRLFLDYNFTAEFEMAFALEDDYLADVDDHEFFFRLSRSVKLDELNLASFVKSTPFGRP